MKRGVIILFFFIQIVNAQSELRQRQIKVYTKLINKLTKKVSKKKNVYINIKSGFEFPNVISAHGSIPAEIESTVIHNDTTIVSRIKAKFKNSSYEFSSIYLDQKFKKKCPICKYGVLISIYEPLDKWRQLNFILLTKGNKLYKQKKIKNIYIPVRVYYKKEGIIFKNKIKFFVFDMNFKEPKLVKVIQ